MRPRAEKNVPAKKSRQSADMNARRCSLIDEVISRSDLALISGRGFSAVDILTDLPSGLSATSEVRALFVFDLGACFRVSAIKFSQRSFHIGHGRTL